MTQCPSCHSNNLLMVEYAYPNPNRYDGISEIRCSDCHIRFGRWSGRILTDGEFEGKYGGTPKSFNDSRELSMTDASSQTTINKQLVRNSLEN